MMHNSKKYIPGFFTIVFTFAQNNPLTDKDYEKKVYSTEYTRSLIGNDPKDLLNPLIARKNTLHNDEVSESSLDNELSSKEVQNCFEHFEAFVEDSLSFSYKDLWLTNEMMTYSFNKDNPSVMEVNVYMTPSIIGSQDNNTRHHYGTMNKYDAHDYVSPYVLAHLDFDDLARSIQEHLNQIEPNFACFLSRIILEWGDYDENSVDPDTGTYNYDSYVNEALMLMNSNDQEIIVKDWTPDHSEVRMKNFDQIFM